MKINACFDDLKESYLFAETAARISAYAQAHPEADIIKMGIGDVTLPLSRPVVAAMEKAAGELGRAETFRGYPSYEGYGFLREAVSRYYASFGVSVSPDEIFISDGAKSDCGNIGDIFARDNTVLVTDPVYPVYVDSNLMAGRKILYARGTAENGFLALPEDGISADLIYLCSPNNPTGAAYTAEQLKLWVDYALKNDAVILYDSAYEAYITDGRPRSIFAVEGARDCAIEFCSLSKTAGFTGTRCGYTVIPRTLVRDGHSLYKLWYRRQSTKFNGVSWPVQCAAAAVFTEEGLRGVRENIGYYHENAKLMMAAFDRLGWFYTGGKNSPYLWVRCPGGMSGWDFFDLLLDRARVAGTPGEGFGGCGSGYFRFTSFSSREKTAEAMARVEKLFEKNA